jgi:hypothetical protein
MIRLHAPTVFASSITIIIRSASTPRSYCGSRSPTAVTSAFASTSPWARWRDLDGSRSLPATTALNELRLMAATLDAEVKLTDAFLVRGEFRIDGADHRVFEDSGGAMSLNVQPTLALNGIYAF